MKATEIKAILWILGLFTLGFAHHQIFSLLKRPLSQEAFSVLSSNLNFTEDSFETKILEKEENLKDEGAQNFGQLTAIPIVTGGETLSNHTDEESLTSKERAKKTSDRQSKISINHADAKELTQIKGVGPKIAEKIIKYRIAHGPFKSGADLLKVKGIGKAKLKTMLMRITFEE